MSTMKLTLPVVVDTTGDVARAYGVRFTPTHFLIDRAGVVRAGGSGARDWNSDAAHAAVGVLLEDPRPSSARQDRATSPSMGKTTRRTR